MLTPRSLVVSLALVIAPVAAGCAAEDLAAEEPAASELAAAAPIASKFHVTELLAKLQHCNVVTSGKYKTDDEAAPSVDICGLHGAFFWKADMDIDCDGKRGAICNESTDEFYQPETSAEDSLGRPLDATKLPYVVIPLPSNRFDYEARGLRLGQVVGVVFNGKIAFGVFGDEGPDDIIGESSVAMAKALGIDANPATGGVDSGVTYIVFTGADAVVPKLEDHAKADQIGKQKLLQVLQAN
jgi:hypothetical protein